MRIRPVGDELFHADRRTDMSKLIVAFRTFVNVPKCTSTYAKTQEIQAHKRNVFSFNLRICILCAFAKFQKVTISFVTSVRLPVRMEQVGSHWTDFQEIFRKFVEKIQVSLKLDNNNSYFTRTTNIHF